MKKALRFFVHHKILTAFLSIILIMVIISQFVAIRLIGVTNIALDRRQMRHVNRIVVETFYGTTIIENRRLVADIVSATMVANDWPVCVGGFNWYTATFRLYRDSTLVRDMELEFKHYQMRVYFPSRYHIFFVGGWVYHAIQEHGGVVMLCRELVDRIQVYLQADGNRLHPFV